MLPSLLFGLLRWPWYTSAMWTAVALLVQVPQNMQWRETMGLTAAPPENIVFAGAVAFAVNLVFYAAGRLLRAGVDRIRASRA